MSVTYSETITLPGTLTLADAEAVADKVREVGTALVKGQKLTMEVEAEDHWELRDTLSDLETTLDSYNIEWRPDRNQVRDEDIDRLGVRVLDEMLHIYGVYQQSYSDTAGLSTEETFRALTAQLDRVVEAQKEKV